MPGIPSPTLSKKFAVVDWCYRKITPLTYTRSVGLAPPPGLGASLIERHRYETSLLPLAPRSSLRFHAWRSNTCKGYSGRRMAARKHLGAV